ncbi:restriction endonuclease subunit S [Flavobacterium sp. W21_SRS_FM6]|uniref:restriction endonuclease subunit S n=1 Tax=Flavobacterium sp. W21_SRS_FM6 TaxID=3240268 RepID=UPI003F8F038D
MSWPLVNLGDVCSFVRGPFGGALKKDSFVEDGFAVYEQQHAIYNQFTSIRYFIDEAKFSELKRFKLNPGDLIMSCSGTMGKIAIVPQDIKTGIINQALLKLTPSLKVDLDYLKYWLESESFQFTLNDNTHGAAIKNVASVAVLKSIKIPLPPLNEQKRIAVILDKADAIRRKRQQAIQLADDFLRSVFLDMFGDPVTNPKGWRKKQLQEVCHKVIDCPHSTPKWTEVGIIGLRTSNLTKGDWNWNDKRFVSEATYKDRTRRAELEENDIILSREGTVGVAALVPANTKMCMGQRLVQLRANTDLICPEFLLFFLLYELEPERISRVMAGSTSKHLNVKDLKSLEVFIPPIDQQEKFASIFRHKKIVEPKFGNSTYQSDLNFQSLSQKAFAGEL